MIFLFKPYIIFKLIFLNISINKPHISYLYKSQHPIQSKHQSLPNNKQLLIKICF